MTRRGTWGLIVGGMFALIVVGSFIVVMQWRRPDPAQSSAPMKATTTWGAGGDILSRDSDHFFIERISDQGSIARVHEWDQPGAEELRVLLKRRRLLWTSPVQSIGNNNESMWVLSERELGNGGDDVAMTELAYARVPLRNLTVSNDENLVTWREDDRLMLMSLLSKDIRVLGVKNPLMAWAPTTRNIALGTPDGIAYLSLDATGVEESRIAVSLTNPVRALAFIDDATLLTLSFGSPMTITTIDLRTMTQQNIGEWADAPSIEDSDVFLWTHPQSSWIIMQEISHENAASQDVFSFERTTGVARRIGKGLRILGWSDAATIIVAMPTENFLRHIPLGEGSAVPITALSGYPVTIL